MEHSQTYQMNFTYTYGKVTYSECVLQNYFLFFPCLQPDDTKMLILMVKRNGFHITCVLGGFHVLYYFGEILSIDSSIAGVCIYTHITEGWKIGWRDD